MTWMVDHRRPAESHRGFEDARKLAESGGWIDWLVSWQDVAAVDAGCRFDGAQAGRVREFFGLLRQSKGQWAGESFELLDWQWRDVTGPMFGWVREDGTRRFRRAYIEIPKKNGKSTWCSGLGLYLLVGDGEPGAEVYSAAMDRAQASIVFKEAASMARKSGLASRGLRIVDSTKTMTWRLDNVYRALSADAPRTEGLNIHGLLFDELHAQRTRALWDALIYGGASRKQPLLVSITTAGYDRTSVCWEEHELARQVIEGTIENWGYLGYISAADETDDWERPATWAKANPSFGVTVFEDEIGQQAAEAAASPSKQNAFRRYRLNQWVSQDERWLDLREWDACTGDLDFAALAGRPCYGGLDLAKTQDLAAFVIVWPPVGDDDPYIVAPWCWLPGDGIVERGNKDHVPYKQWAEQGFLELTPGDEIDQSFVRYRISELRQRFDLRMVAFDRWGSVETRQLLEKEGLVMVDFGQGFASMSGPCSDLMQLVLRRKLRHDGHPVLRWCADNLVMTQDPAGNLKPDKGKARQKIDLMVALLMGLDMAVRQANATAPGVYVI